LTRRFSPDRRLLLRFVSGLLAFGMIGAAAVPVGGSEPAGPKTITVLPARPENASSSYAIVLLRRTPQERVKGLQEFRTLHPGEAALFVFDKPERVSFWMASVPYAIDIIYVGSDGAVREVFPDCQPESQEIYQAHAPVRWVIETLAGSGIRAGDRVSIE
jgi:uncharacterized membrane protein (UPF0127 family)